MERWWFDLVAAGVQRYLEDVVAGVLARTEANGPEVRRLAAAWRALLRLHQPGSNGRCSRCCRRRRQDDEICTVWQVAIAYFVRRLPDELKR